MISALLAQSGILSDPSLRLWICGIAIAGGLVLLYGIVSRQRGRLGPSQGSATREREASTREQEALRRDIEHLMVELRGLSEQLGQQLDARQQKLARLVAEADERITVLRCHVRGPAEAGAAADEMDEIVREAPAALPASALSLAVYELADGGMSPNEVARQVGRTTGEVELILNLRGTGRTGQAAGSW